ncbi:MAG: S66 peptidase family protein [Candidatus Paceibacterota bacterium]|jgi:muramoyltetrapeptide carboxypeptidase LdcA involved in peptidoglycan recycling
MLKPKALKRGDTIAIISPSSDISRFPKRTRRAVAFLEKRGYKIKMMPSALKTDGYSGGKAKDRALDINNAFADKKIDAILCSTGGLTANAVLPYINYKLIASNPKIFCGYSDITTLLLMITSKSKIVTFHGPTLLPSFGEFEGSVSFTFDQFEKLISSKKGVGLLPKAKKYSIDNQYWEKQDNKKLKMVESPKIVSFGPKGTFSGSLFGGNLQTFVMLMKEESFFNLNGAILFLEESGLSTDWYERYIIELERNSVFEKINGLIFGNVSGGFKESGGAKRSLGKLLKEISKKYNLPILANIDCGHTKPLLTFPLGVEVGIDTKNKKIFIKEAAVQ